MNGNGHRRSASSPRSAGGLRSWRSETAREKEEWHACIRRNYDSQSVYVRGAAARPTQRKPGDTDADAGDRSSTHTNSNTYATPTPTPTPTPTSGVVTINVVQREWRAVLLAESGNAAGRTDGRVAQHRPRHPPCRLE